MEFVRRRPASALRPLIAWYSGYREAGVPPRRHRGLPSPYLTMIITLHDPLVITAHPDPRTPSGTYDTLVGGLHTTPALITHDGRQSGVQIALTPLGARALLGLPAGELSGLDLDGADVLGRLAAELRERLLETGGWAERFTVLDRVLGGVLAATVRPGSPAPEVAHAWRLLLAADGDTSVADLAEQVGWSTRHLSQRFRTEIGLGPKEAARVVRFDRARWMMRRSAESDDQHTLAEIAAACGYYDQAHLAREFGAFAGCPPSQWLAEEFGQPH
ncbi:helix-turn-helix domain-containing protein [Sphaerimonospora thailandensis]|uniref:AraC family transcriptional regulator n=1 Tax=Sphaerimonospora thailandensis TaxID=795644 RepID=A0A8J3RC30_9ACTN|nr:helix-turn-helix domain-containing protein [Sphaerimonospora thailandensis]GIH71112.1 AraC family transcriptional regulator [Sphaerimonospora thailandensis]